MRLKLDENLPEAARLAAAALGHDVDTVLDEAIGGAADPEVLAAATCADRFLLTLDRGLGDVRSYPPGSHPGVAVLRVDSQDATSVAEAVRGFLANDTLGDLTGCLVVVRGHLIRVRRRKWRGALFDFSPSARISLRWLSVSPKNSASPSEESFTPSS